MYLEALRHPPGGSLGKEKVMRGRDRFIVSLEAERSVRRSHVFFLRLELIRKWTRPRHVQKGPPRLPKHTEPKAVHPCRHPERQQWNPTLCVHGNGQSEGGLLPGNPSYWKEDEPLFNREGRLGQLPASLGAQPLGISRAQSCPWGPEPSGVQAPRAEKGPVLQRETMFGAQRSSELVWKRLKGRFLKLSCSLDF